MRIASGLRGPLLSALVLTGLAATAPAAKADQVHATRYELTERSHVVDMKVDRGFATLVVQRTVHNRGPASDQAMFWIELPPGAVATRLRTAGVSPTGQVQWFEGELMEAEAAAAKYRELTGIGGYTPKDPALLSWRTQTELALQVFPVPKLATKTVEYTLKIPLEYKEGAYHLTLPRLGTDELAATVHAEAVHPEDVLTVSGVRAPVTASAKGELSFELVPKLPRAVELSLASVPLAPARHLVHGRIEVAPRVAEAPKNAHVVVLFDASRSHHAADVALTMVRAYLGSMPGATVDFLTFDRAVKAPIGRTLPVTEAISRLAGLTATLGNGSAIDTALTEADALLERSPSTARRVVVVTDRMTRSDLTPAKLGALGWKSGAVVHVATVESGDSGLERDDASEWAVLPRRTGGLAWNATSSGVVDGRSRAAFEELARPKRIDRVVIQGFSAPLVAPSSLAEGEAVDHQVLADQPTSTVTLDGELWSRPVRFTMAPTTEHNRREAALVFGSSLLGELSETEQMSLALLGRAVSPVTSYLAIEPGVRPSTEGLDWGTTGFGMGGGARGEGIGLGSLGTIGHGSGVPKDRWLEDEIRKAARVCGASSGEASVQLETTVDEIVDVKRVELRPGRDGKAEGCLREAVWSLVLPPSFAAAFEDRSIDAKL